MNACILYWFLLLSSWCWCSLSHNDFLVWILVLLAMYQRTTSLDGNLFKFVYRLKVCLRQMLDSTCLLETAMRVEINYNSVVVNLFEWNFISVFILLKSIQRFLLSENLMNKQCWWFFVFPCNSLLFSVIWWTENQNPKLDSEFKDFFFFFFSCYLLAHLFQDATSELASI